MSLKFKYIFFITVIHIALLVVIYYLLKDKLWYFLASEVLVFMSYFIGILLYGSFIRPHRLLKSGTDAIADKDFSVKYIKTGSSEVDALVDVYNNMIDTLRTERVKISEQSFFIQKLIEVTPIGIIIMDYDGLIANINPAARQHLNLDIHKQVIGTNLSSHQSQFSQILQEQVIRESKIVSENGMEKYKVQINEVIHQGFKRKFILIDDLSKELIQSEKDAFGRIIRMMAHEVNNSMGAINSILDSVIEFGYDTNDDLVRESLEVAKNRNVGLASFMANYASLLRLPPPVKKTLDLGELLRKAAQLFFQKAKEHDIKFNFNFPSDTVNLHADTVLLEQAVSNMIKNSIESIGSVGEIIISCQESPLQFTISDNGKGISDEAASNLFKPFYSTKMTGQGVGLMLIKDVLHSHEATFKLYTDSTSGWTHFEVRFKS